MKINRIIEYAFFFILLALAGYMVWLIAEPFISALALAVIIVTICQPLHSRMQKLFPKRKTLSALLTTLLALVVVVLPVVFVSSLVATEVTGVYQSLTAEGDIDAGQTITRVEGLVQTFIPGFEINLTEQLTEVAQWFTGNITQILVGTVSTIFIFVISLIGSFYFFRDGKEFLQILIKVSPLPDKEDTVILQRIAQAIRSVATGTLLIALIQGTLVAIGFSIVGIPNVILWGSVTSVLAIIPGVGTGFVTFPAIFWLFYSGEIFFGIILTLWAMFVVGLVDNILGPYLMSRGNNLHPFIILIAVLGGISLFGPIGFIVGPMIVTLFVVLLEIYSQYIIKEQLPSESPSEVIETKDE
jgi:predicted PurR-regulated permease PerM